MKIKLDGKYIDGNGVMVRRVLAIDGFFQHYPVVCEMVDGVINTYTEEGYYSINNKNAYDLIECDERAEWKLNTLLVIGHGSSECLRHFAGIKNGVVHCFSVGTHSLTGSRTALCDDARLATPADIERLRPHPEAWWAKP